MSAVGAHQAQGRHGGSTHAPTLGSLSVRVPLQVLNDVATITFSKFQLRGDF